jgi:DNA uptake protein ComE-like DNA-binding protein
MPPRRRRSWKEDLKDIFSVHRGERRGMMVLIGLCLLAAGWVTYEQWIRPATVEDPNDLKVAWSTLQDSIKVKEKEYRQRPKQHHVQLFAFDPNGLPTEQWVQLGLSERQAGAIHKYEEHGGKFRVKADVARMRVVDPELFAQWEPYIQLPDSLPRKTWGNYAGRDHDPLDPASRKAGGKFFAPEDRNTVVELNTADSTALVTVRGIGPSFARAIIRYRDRLGGYVSLDQLNEVYILRDKPDAVERIRPHLSLDPAMVKMIHLNSCTVEDLGPHPYAGWKVANALVSYRKQHGPFPTVDAITNCILVTDSIRDRLAPYLTLE